VAAGEPARPRRDHVEFDAAPGRTGTAPAAARADETPARACSPGRGPPARHRARRRLRLGRRRHVARRPRLARHRRRHLARRRRPGPPGRRGRRPPGRRPRHLAAPPTSPPGTPTTGSTSSPRTTSTSPAPRGAVRPPRVLGRPRRHAARRRPRLHPRPARPRPRPQRPRRPPQRQPDSPADTARVRLTQITSALPQAEWEIVVARAPHPHHQQARRRPCGRPGRHRGQGTSHPVSASTTRRRAQEPAACQTTRCCSATDHRSDRGRRPGCRPLTEPRRTGVRWIGTRWPAL
jgi:hypothetical protein